MRLCWLTIPLHSFITIIYYINTIKPKADYHETDYLHIGLDTS